jgi:hypothetical protein
MYVIVAVPLTTPVTTPVEEATVATAGLPEDHTPPVVASARVVPTPAQALSVPVIAAGSELTVITAVVLQPVLSV